MTLGIIGDYCENIGAPYAALPLPFQQGDNFIGFVGESHILLRDWEFRGHMWLQADVHGCRIRSPEGA